MSKTPEPGADLVEIGVVVRRHGVRGELRLLPHNPDTEVIGAGRRVHLRCKDGSQQWRTIESSRPHKNLYLVFFAGVASTEQADALVGARAAVQRQELPELGADERYWFELVGCRVESETGRVLGRVAEVLATGSNDVLVVRDGDTEHLIPWIDDVVVDSDADRIVVRAVAGLLANDDSPVE